MRNINRHCVSDDGGNQITFSNDGSYRFNDKITHAPQIVGVTTVSPVVLAK